MVRNLFYILFILSWCLLTSADETEVSKPKDIKFEANKEKKEVRFPVELIASEQMLEVLACTENGPTHETVLLMEPIGVKLYEALKSFGLRSAIEWQEPIKDGFNLSMGDKVLIQFVSPDINEGKPMFIEDMLVYKPTQVHMMMRGWSFKGDQITENGKSTPIADAEISLINKGRNTSPVTILLNPTNLIDCSESEYNVSKKLAPYLKKLADKNKVKGELIIVPASEEKIAELNLNRYDSKDLLLLDALDCAKKIDQLKSKYYNKLRGELVDVIVAASAENVTEAQKQEFMTQYKLISKSCDVTLHQASYLHHLKIYKEYLYVLNQMRKAAVSQEESDSLRIFGVYTSGFAEYLQKEKEYLFKQKEVELELLKTEDDGVKLKNKIKMYKALQQEQIVSFNVDLIGYQLEVERKRLQADDVKSNELIRKTFLESVKNNELEEAYNKKWKKFCEVSANAFKLLSESADASAEIKESKKGLLLTALAKNEVLLYSLRKRKVTLKEYLDETKDKEDRIHYEEKIKETGEGISKSEELSKKFLKLIDEIDNDKSSLDEFIEIYQDAIKMD